MPTQSRSSRLACDCMSKLTLTSRPATTSTRTSPVSGSTIGRFDRSCGAIGTSTQPLMPGCRIGPPAESA
jgi:hypothetical protein